MSTCSLRIRCSSRSNGPSKTGVATVEMPYGTRLARHVAWRAVTRVLSCIQPTGDVHLGNYLGALRNWVDRPARGDAFHGIVDLHALTVTETPGVIGETTLRLAAMLFADRPRSGRRHRVRAEPRRRALPARLGDGVHRQLRRAEPDDPVQGEVGQARGRLRLGRAVHLPGAAGRRHRPLRRRRGARSATTSASTSRSPATSRSASTTASATRSSSRRRSCRRPARG